LELAVVLVFGSLTSFEVEPYQYCNLLQTNFHKKKDDASCLWMVVVVTKNKNNIVTNLDKIITTIILFVI
jgi:hypothetical protein